MRKSICILIVLVFASACKEKSPTPKEWVLSKTIQLDGVNPIGLTQVNGAIWLSDGDHNRLVQIDTEGKITETVDSLDRPMHIDAIKETIFIPQYGKDVIETVDKKGRFIMQVSDSLDAPAGVSVYENERAIADFYNNRILYFDGASWISFGKEGKAEGEFYYPTDVQITKDKIWVADAYNNRVQVFDKKGGFLQMMGQNQKMNAATGIFVSVDEVFVTDFENNRVLVFDMMGELQQVLKDQIEKPTDMMIKDDMLYVINYRNGKLNIFDKQPIVVKD
ncbi:NHL repeat-containing protein [Maribacter sedimenticola]|uniref:NHL repeat-containing protein n=1 Tax=Maribacter sedimenticola TaxID=228956 RepID=A0ABY1SHE8_9FLAO|nr:NHL repeat-containing protein [Maribacter sedimenticola]SNR53522.1 NHL repeat-containing protein [Maribacter sedimenticola]